MIQIGQSGVQLKTSSRIAEAIAFDLMAWWHLRSRSVKWIVPNIYVLNWFEADVCAIRTPGLIDEFEIKISRSDFLADAKKRDKFGDNRKTKHERLAAGVDEHPLAAFWFVTPPGIIKPGELPEFAGHIEVEFPRPGEKVRCLLSHKLKVDMASFTIVKHAPKLRRQSDEAGVAAVNSALAIMAYRYLDQLKKGYHLHKPVSRYTEE